MFRLYFYQKGLNTFGQELKNNRYIKVPEGAIRRANEKGILKDLEFYYQLKVINEEGFFKKGTVVPSIQEKYKIAQSSIWRKIRRLSKLGLIRKDRGGYRLVKYDTLFSILGYDLKQNVKKKRAGNFKIFKIGLDKVDQLILYVAKEEIDLNLDRQAFKVWKKIRRSNQFKQLLRKERTLPTSLREIRAYIDKLYSQANKVESLELQSESKEAQRYLEASAKHTSKDLDYVNLDITLSNQGLAKLLGYKTTLKGFQIQNLLNKIKLIKSEKRELYIGTTSLTYNEFRKEFKDPTYRLVDSSIIKRMPNKIVVL